MEMEVSNFTRKSFAGIFELILEGTQKKYLYSPTLGGEWWNPLSYYCSSLSCALKAKGLTWSFNVFKGIGNVASFPFLLKLWSE